jgi:single-strand DNA-binding protein
MNVITVAGNVSQEAEVRFTPGGDAVANFSVADNQGKDKDALFWRCSLFGKRAESLSTYLVKGQAVTVSGTVSKRDWTDKDGNKREQYDIRVNDVALQGGRKEASPPQERAPAKAKPTPNFSDMDQDVPF